MNGLNEEDLKRHVKDKDTWLHFVYLVLFGVILYVSTAVVFVISIVQFFAKLLSGACFAVVTDFGDNLAIYQAALIRFVTFASDEKPFPFMPFPSKSVTILPPEPPFH